MKLPSINIDELNKVGTEAAPMPTYAEPDSLEAKLRAQQDRIWASTMPEERDIIRRVVETLKPFTLDLGDPRRHEQFRMRLYRAKRQLLKNQNPYVTRITFTTNGTRITVKLVESLMQYHVPTETDDL